MISPGPRGTRGYGAGGRTFFGQKKIKPTTLHPRRQPATRPRAPHHAPNPHKQTTPQKPHTRAGAHTRAPRAPNARGRAHTRARAQKAKKNSAIGTRTRVSWVKAKYDNHRVAKTYGFFALHLCPLSFQEGIAEFCGAQQTSASCGLLIFPRAGFLNRPSGKPVIQGLTRLPRVKSCYGWRIRKSSRARTGRRATSNPSCRNRAVASSHGSARIV